MPRRSRRQQRSVQKGPIKDLAGGLINIIDNILKPRGNGVQATRTQRTRIRPSKAPSNLMGAYVPLPGVPDDVRAIMSKVSRRQKLTPAEADRMAKYRGGWY